MIDFKWIITDEFVDHKTPDNYSSETFPYIDGYFDMTINQRNWVGFLNIEDIKYYTFVRDFPFGGDSLMEIFLNFSKVLHLKPSQIFLFQPMDLPLISLLFDRETDTLRISQQRDEEKISEFLKEKPKWIPPACWTETVNFEEFKQEVINNIQQFIAVIDNENPELLHNKYMKELINILDEVEKD